MPVTSPSGVGPLFNCEMMVVPNAWEIKRTPGIKYRAFMFLHWTAVSVATPNAGNREKFRRKILGRRKAASNTPPLPVLNPPGAWFKRLRHQSRMAAHLHRL